MSGGSFNYLYCADDLGSREEDLKEMAEELRSLGFYEMYEDTLSFLPPEPPAELREAWRAVEWWRSNDYSVRQAVIAAETYMTKRGELVARADEDGFRCGCGVFHSAAALARAIRKPATTTTTAEQS